MKIIAFMFMLFPAVSQAADLRLTISGLSYHKDRSIPYNEVNPGIGVGYGTDAFFVEVGQYKNSFYQKTEYLWVGGSFQVVGCLRLGGILGLATGYDLEAVGISGPFVQCKDGRFLVSDRAVAFQYVRQFEGLLPW